MDQFCSACNYALELLKLVQCNHLSYHKKQAIRCLKLKNKLVQVDKHPTEGFGTFLSPPGIALPLAVAQTNQVTRWASVLSNVK